MTNQEAPALDRYGGRVQGPGHGAFIIVAVYALLTYGGVSVFVVVMSTPTTPPLGSGGCAAARSADASSTGLRSCLRRRRRAPAGSPRNRTSARLGASADLPATIGRSPPAPAARGREGGRDTG